jgi:hypothetical protein
MIYAPDMIWKALGPCSKLVKIGPALEYALAAILDQNWPGPSKMGPKNDQK